MNCFRIDCYLKIKSNQIQNNLKTIRADLFSCFCTKLEQTWITLFQLVFVTY